MLTVLVLQETQSPLPLEQTPLILQNPSSAVQLASTVPQVLLGPSFTHVSLLIFEPVLLLDLTRSRPIPRGRAASGAGLLSSETTMPSLVPRRALSFLIAWTT